MLPPGKDESNYLDGAEEAYPFLWVGNLSLETSHSYTSNTQRMPRRLRTIYKTCSSAETPSESSLPDRKFHFRRYSPCRRYSPDREGRGCHVCLG